MIILFLLSSNLANVEVVFTNNAFGSLAPSYAYFMDLEMPPPLGDAASFKTLIEFEKKEGKDPVVLSSGNLFPFNFPGDYLPSEEISGFLKACKFDAVLIGTNELSFGVDYLMDVIRNAGTPFLSANILSSTLRKPYIMMEREGVKIGIGGITTLYTNLFVPSNVREEYELMDVYPAIENMVRDMRNSGADIIILLSDAGFTKDSTIADSIPGIDVIIGSSERGRPMKTPFETPKNHTILYKGYTNFSSAGILNLFYDKNNKVLAGYRGKIVTLFAEEFYMDKKVLGIVER